MNYELLLALVTKIFGLTESEAKEKLIEQVEGKDVLKSDAKEIILSLNEKKIEKVRTDITKAYDDGAKKEKARVMKQVEDDLKKFAPNAEKYEEMVNFISESFKDDPDGKKRKKGDPITEDEIKKHPFFLQHEAKVKSDYVPKSEYDKIKSEHDATIKAEARRNIEGKVNEVALKHIAGMSPGFAFSQNPAIKENQIKTIMSQLSGRYDNIIEENGRLILEKDGKRVEDVHGNPIKPEDLVTEIAGSFLDRMVQNPTPGSTGGQNPGNPGGLPAKKYTGKIPADYAEMKALAGTLPADEKAALIEAWGATYGGSGK